MPRASGGRCSGFRGGLQGGLGRLRRGLRRRLRGSGHGGLLRGLGGGLAAAFGAALVALVGGFSAGSTAAAAGARFAGFAAAFTARFGAGSTAVVGSLVAAFFVGLAAAFGAASVAIGSPPASRCPSASNRSTEPATAAFSEPITPRIGIRTNRSQRRRIAGLSPWPSLPMTSAIGPRRSASRDVSAASAAEPTIRRPAEVEVGQRAGKVVDRRQEEVLRRARGGLDGRRRERCLVLGREDDAVCTGRLGAAKERADVLRVFEGVEDEHERRLAALDRPREDVLERREPTRLDHDGDTLVAIETGERRQRAALDLDDRDAQRRGVQDDPLERLAPLRSDEQPARRTTGGERLLDRATPGDELLTLGELRRCRRTPRGRLGRLEPPRRALLAAGERPRRSVLPRAFELLAALAIRTPRPSFVVGGTAPRLAKPIVRRAWAVRGESRPRGEAGRPRSGGRAPRSVEGALRSVEGARAPLEGRRRFVVPRPIPEAEAGAPAGRLVAEPVWSWPRRPTGAAAAHRARPPGRPP